MEMRRRTTVLEWQEIALNLTAEQWLAWQKQVIREELLEELQGHDPGLLRIA